MIDRRERKTTSNLRDIPERGTYTAVDTINNIISDKFELQKTAYAVASGLKYGQLNYFIRNSFPFDYNQIIDNPVYVIEYLLRRYTNYEIDVNSFDATAQTNIARAISINFSLNEKVNIITLINEILLLFFGVLYIEQSKLKITTIHDKEVVGTINKTLIQDGNRDIKINFDKEIYSSFDFEMFYFEPENEYFIKYHIDKNGSDLQFVGLDVCSICNYIETNLQIKRNYAFQTKYANSIAVRPFFEYFTKIKMILEFRLSIKDGIRYEIGDCVLVNMPDILPSNYNNSKKFIVIGKELHIGNNPYIRLRLLENPFSGYLD